MGQDGTSERDWRLARLLEKLSVPASRFEFIYSLS